MEREIEGLPLATSVLVAPTTEILVEAILALEGRSPEDRSARLVMEELEASRAAASQAGDLTRDQRSFAVNVLHSIVNELRRALNS